MTYPQKLLNANERVVLDLHPHWVVLLRPAAIASLSILLFAPLAQRFDARLAYLIAPSLLWFGWALLVRRTTNFVVTTDRVVFRAGVLAKTGMEIPLERVNNIHFNQTLFERVVRAGDLLIESGGESGQELFEDIPSPDLVQNEIARQSEENSRRMYRPGDGCAECDRGEQSHGHTHG